MQPKVLRTEADYETALQMLEQLWDAPPGSPEEDQAELWTLLIEKYEKKQFVIELPDPISAIRFRMEQAGLKNKDLVPYIGRPGRVSEVLNGKRKLSLRMIRALHAGLGIPLESLLGTEEPDIPEELTGVVWERFPIAEMRKRGWFANFSGTLSEARQQIEELLRAMVVGLDESLLQPACLRSKVRFGGKFDPYALTAWKLRIHSLCQQIKLKPYSPGTITPDFIRQVVKLSVLPGGPKRAREFLAECGIYLVVEPHMPCTHLDGAAFWHQEHPVVALTLRHDRADNFWFTLAHELAHFARHIQTPQEVAFLDNLEEQANSRQETEADQTALECCIPKAAWNDWFPRRNPGAAAVRSFARQHQIHPAIVAGRVRHELNNYRILCQLVKAPVRRFWESHHD